MSHQVTEPPAAITIRLRSETREKLTSRAGMAGVSLESFIEGIAEREAESDGSPDAVKRAVARLQSRTPEQMLADRQRILGLTPEPRPLPPGKTLFDVVEGSWPGDETEEQVRASLEKLS